MRRSVVRAVCAAAVVAALVAGCSDVEAEPAPSETVAESVATPTPTALSEAEALEIGVATYEKFLEAERDVITSGGEDIATMDALITDNMGDYRDELMALATEGTFTPEGEMSIIGTRIQSYSLDTVTYYACLDFGDSQLVDEDGKPLDPNRQDVIQAVEVRVVQVSTQPKIDKHESWNDSSACQ